MAHLVGDVWKENRDWKIQMPNGIHTTGTKKRAKLFSMSVSSDPVEQQKLKNILGIKD